MVSSKLEVEIKRYADLNGYPISLYRDVQCACGARTFRLYSDDEEGGAYVTCTVCDTDIDLENSEEFIEEAMQNVCECENEVLQLGVGKSIDVGTNVAKWVYVGARCEKCDLVGVYVDWQVR